MVIVPAFYGLYFMGAQADCVKISTLASVALLSFSCILTQRGYSTLYPFSETSALIQLHSLPSLLQLLL